MDSGKTEIIRAYDLEIGDRFVRLGVVYKVLGCQMAKSGSLPKTAKHTPKPQVKLGFFHKKK
jgi:hypothetical protein